MSATPVVSPLDGARIAIVHEWVDAYAGSEQVFETIAQSFPTADLYALSVNPDVTLDVGDRRIATTFLDRPQLRQRRNVALPLMPLAWRALGGGGYDLVISSHHAFAHANRLTRQGGVHLAYVHTPARYLWTPEIDGRGTEWYVKPAAHVLRRVDVRASQRVNAFAANSAAVADRIKRFWGRESTVLHPPVRVDYFAEPSVERPTRSYVLGVGRWIRYKNLDLVIRAADQVGLPVKIAGGGPDRQRIVAAAAEAKVPVELVDSPPDEELRDLYRNAACLVFPNVEDFGLVPVEAQAAGTPVVGPRAGGLVDSVVDGSTGFLTDDLDLSSIVRGIEQAIGLDGEACRESAARFSHDNFRSNFVAWCVRSCAEGRLVPVGAT